MKRDIHFWFVTLVRGFVALLAGSAILVVPDMARSLLLLPIAVTIAILGLAAYGVVDSTLIFVSSFMVEHPRPRLTLRVQGLIGVSIGILLLSVVLERVQLKWFLSLAAVQALSMAVGEFAVARHQKYRALSIWNYAAATVAVVFACACAIIRIQFAERLTDAGMSWLIYAYLVALGMAQCLTAARMIYADYRIEHAPKSQLAHQA